jgi:hypothetical protein
MEIKEFILSVPISFSVPFHPRDLSQQSDPCLMDDGGGDQSGYWMRYAAAVLEVSYLKLRIPRNKPSKQHPCQKKRGSILILYIAKKDNLMSSRGTFGW